MCPLQTIVEETLTSGKYIFVVMQKKNVFCSVCFLLKKKHIYIYIYIYLIDMSIKKNILSSLLNHLKCLFYYL